jgi:hypothetical protein
MSISIFLLTLVFTFMAGWYIPVLIEYVQLKMKIRQIKKTLSPQPIDPNKLCTKKHAWIKAMVCSKNGEERVEVCRICGLISGKELMATPEALDKIEEDNMLNMIEQQTASELLATDDAQIKKIFAEELDSGLNIDKLITVHAMGLTFLDRLKSYREQRRKELKQELTKGNA